MNAGIPPRGFARMEFEQRCERARASMRAAELDVLLLTTEPQLRYFTGFLTQFWQSPTRPWFLLLPLDAAPIAVIPTIGVEGMRATWIEDIRSWSSPAPEDDGVSLLSAALAELPRRFGRAGATLGIESTLRMPARDFERLRADLAEYEWTDCSELMLRLCSVKSPAEIAKIRYACQLVSDSFDALPGFARSGMTEREVVREMRIDLLRRGADLSPYMVAASGQGGYGDIIMGPRDRRLGAGDVLIIDTGTVYDGYFSDFDRNFAFRQASPQAEQAYRTLYASTEAGLAAARPGALTRDVWAAMWRVLEQGGATGNQIGRMGHGLGAQLTEWPSLSASDTTRLEAGMVITLEPGMTYAENTMMVHEENLVITEDGAELLSRRAPDALPIID